MSFFSLLSQCIVHGGNCIEKLELKAKQGQETSNLSKSTATSKLSLLNAQTLQLSLEPVLRELRKHAIDMNRAKTATCN